MDVENAVTRAPARVLARLTEDTLTVTLHPGQGLADGGVTVHLPLALVPPDLRMPNSEFDVILDPRGQEYARVARKTVATPGTGAA